MSFCPECGKQVAPTAKFCRNCGASQLEESPPNIPAAVQPLVTQTCASYGNPLGPDEKTTCDTCKSKADELQSPALAPSTPVSPPPPPPITEAPPPPPASYSPPPLGTRLCRSCGYVISPGDKFCGKCLAKVEDFPATPSPPPSLKAEVPPPVSLPVCRSCGSTINRTEKFCGICGTPVVSAPTPLPAVSSSESLTCKNCGAPVSATTKFCGGCGTAVGAVLTSGITQPTPTAAHIPTTVTAGSTAASGEEVIGVIGNARKMKMFGASWDTFTLVVTNRRMIVAQMTQALLNAAIMEAQSKAKSEGKGFFAIMKDQMAAQFRFALRYESMSPDQSLAETPGNIVIENTQITAIHMKLKDSGSGDMEYTEFRMIIESAGGKFEYLIGEDDRFINLLKTVYGDRVHMPFGYFKAGGVRLKFF